ncbi:MAG: HlyD family secretion protein [bacterium]
MKQLVITLVLVILAGCSQRNSETFTASGIVEGTAVKVAAQTGGYILKVNFEEGKDVEQGQVIAVVDTEKLFYQLEQIEAALEEVKAQYEINLNILEKAKLDYEHITKKYNRYQDLYEKKSASEQLLDDLKSAYDAAKTQLENAQQNLKLVESKQKGLEAQRKLLQRQIRDATITAPLSGTVTTKYFEAGETIPTGAAVVEIIDLEKMWTKVYVSVLLLPKIKVGQEVEIRIDGSDQTLTGYVSWISPKAEFTPKNILTKESRTSRVYAVKVNVNNRDRLLKHGMPVEIGFHF